VKVTLLLATPLTVTTTGPVEAVAGTGTVIELAFQFVGVAVTPLNVTVLVPWVAPKFDPLIVTGVAIGPDVGVRVLIVGGGLALYVTIAAPHLREVPNVAVAE
jgi:hypothetical protein